MTIRTFTNFKIQISPDDLRKLEEHLQLHPDNLEFIDWAAFAWYSNGVLDKAIEAYRKLIAAKPDNPSYHYYLGNLLFKTGDPAGARTEWELVVRIDQRGQYAVRARRKLLPSQEPEPEP